MKKTDELLKKKLIKQIQAISDNTHKSFSAFAFAAATAARDTTRLFASEIETGDFLVRPDVYARTSTSAICDAIMTYIELVSVSDPYTDLLSPIYSELILDGAPQAKRNGQFYTPDSVATAVAEMMGNRVNIIELDMCCGMGALSLARAKYKLEQGQQINKMICIDLDDVAIACCFAQLAYNNLMNTVIHSIELCCRNAITDYNQGYETTISYRLKINEGKKYRQEMEYLDLATG